MYKFRIRGTHWLQTMPNTAYRLLYLIHNVCGGFGAEGDQLDTRVVKWFYAQQTGQECADINDLAQLLDSAAMEKQIPVFRSMLHFVDQNFFRLEPYSLALKVQRLTGQGLWPLFQVRFLIKMDRTGKMSLERTRGHTSSSHLTQQSPRSTQASLFSPRLSMNKSTLDLKADIALSSLNRSIHLHDSARGSPRLIGRPPASSQVDDMQLSHLSVGQSARHEAASEETIRKGTESAQNPEQISDA